MCECACVGFSNIDVREKPFEFWKRRLWSQSVIFWAAPRNHFHSHSFTCNKEIFGHGSSTAVFRLSMVVLKEEILQNVILNGKKKSCESFGDFLRWKGWIMGSNVNQYYKFDIWMN